MVLYIPRNNCGQTNKRLFVHIFQKVLSFAKLSYVTPRNWSHFSSISPNSIRIAICPFESSLRCLFIECKNERQLELWCWAKVLMPLFSVIQHKLWHPTFNGPILSRLLSQLQWSKEPTQRVLTSSTLGHCGIQGLLRNPEAPTHLMPSRVPPVSKNLPQVSLNSMGWRSVYPVPASCSTKELATSKWKMAVITGN